VNTENELDEIRAILRDVAINHQTSLLRLDRIEALAASNTVAIERNAQAINQLTSDIGGLALQIEQMSREAQQDRTQAAIDRAEFRSTIQTVLDAWTERFGTNGHT
jgi:outer membrane murein-binding lipoprotein Lpp